MPYIEQPELDLMLAEVTRAAARVGGNPSAVSYTQAVQEAVTFCNTRTRLNTDLKARTAAEITTICNIIIVPAERGDSGSRARRKYNTAVNLRATVKNLLNTRNELLTFLTGTDESIASKIEEEIVSMRGNTAQSYRFFCSMSIATLASARYLKNLKEQTESEIDHVLVGPDFLLRAENALANMPLVLNQKQWFAKQHLEQRIQVAAQAQFDALGGGYGRLNDDEKHAALTGAQAAPVVGNLAQNHLQNLIARALVIVNAAINRAAQQLFTNLTTNATYAAPGVDDQAKRNILAGVAAGPGETNARYITFVNAELAVVDTRIATANATANAAATAAANAAANAAIAANVAQAQFDALGGGYGRLNDDEKHAALTGAQAAPVVGNLAQNHLQNLIARALVIVNAAINRAAQQLFTNLTTNATYAAPGVDDQAKRNILAGVAAGPGETNARYRRLIVTELAVVDARILASKNAAQAQFDIAVGGAAAYAVLDDNAKHVALMLAQGAGPVVDPIQENHFRTLIRNALAIVNADINRAAQQLFTNLTTHANYADPGVDNQAKRNILAGVAAGPDETGVRYGRLIVTELAVVDAHIIASKNAAQAQFDIAVGGAAVYAGFDDNAKHAALMRAQGATAVVDPIQENHFRTLITNFLVPVDLATTAAAKAQFDALGGGGGYRFLADDQAKRAVLAALPPAVPPVTETERKFRILVANELARLAPAAFLPAMSAATLDAQQGFKPAAIASAKARFGRK